MTENPNYHRNILVITFILGMRSNGSNITIHNISTDIFNRIAFVNYLEQIIQSKDNLLSKVADDLLEEYNTPNVKFEALKEL